MQIVFKNKKGQLTIFIIIAIVIVAAIALYFLIPRMKPRPKVEEPQLYVQDCVKDSIEEAKEIVVKRGGSLEPENYIMYDNDPVEYLCYTRNYYVTCATQQPLLKAHIESEIKSYIEPKVKECIDNLETDLKRKHYDVDIKKSKMELNVEIKLKKISVKIDVPMTVSKAEEDSKTYKKFDVSIPSQLDDLIMISVNILNWEARYGDAEITEYMFKYPDIKVEKYKRGEGSTIYIVTDRDTNEQFKFASRSLAFPPGYGIENIPENPVIS